MTAEEEQRERQAGIFAELMKQTPARLAVGRAGTRPTTGAMLKLRLDHAEAVDAVYGEVGEETLEAFGLFSVDTRFGNKETYLKRPDLGRILAAEAETVILARCIHEAEVQIVVSDGLSAKAVEDNLADVLPALLDSLEINGLQAGTPFFVRGGRVGCMDEIGRLLEPKTLVLLIGERPGLVTASSLSAYLCYKPRPGCRDADRTVISNIHRGGTPPVEAGAHIGSLLRKMIEQKVSGIGLIV
ncbi:MULTISPECIES: ethanolamine ammonia-lyase subunit EutC [Paenibacillus]|uniref:ethanolamine ammonia-lyase subunit EutC n=1 Tax=Paenibacillus TaxID=44249 RepID=UPI0022B862E5|nr:ethanolamine ammonia-lyase subunit EutC [Paenibacillus caseinilyticus]MCZ8522450.1 ethanolamine ammonia-lyase subunit EutC [Paenibacillus caseinilyticus]